MSQLNELILYACTHSNKDQMAGFYLQKLEAENHYDYSYAVTIQRFFGWKKVHWIGVSHFCHNYRIRILMMRERKLQSWSFIYVFWVRLEIVPNIFSSNGLSLWFAIFYSFLLLHLGSLPLTELCLYLVNLCISHAMPESSLVVV